MKFFTGLAIAAGTALGTATVINYLTDGCSNEQIKERIFGTDIDDPDDFPEDFDDEIKIKKVDIPEDNDQYFLNYHSFQRIQNANGDKLIAMPIKNAIDIYQCIEQAVGELDPDTQSDEKVFGDKALSFECLYDILEEDLKELESQNSSTEDSESPEE